MASDCQEIVGRHQPNGYAQVWLGGTYVYAHRLSWALHSGADPAGKVVMHTCDNPSCVNPEHLKLGTQGDNMRDCAAKGRIRGGAKKSRYCANGHDTHVCGRKPPYAGNGCKACAIEQQRAHRLSALLEDDNGT